MAKKLEGFKWHSLWTTHIGCMKGCVDYLNLDISLPWLFGGTGHSFVMNIHEELCPSGPTAWKCKMLYELAPNLGFDSDGFFSYKDGHGPVPWKDAPKKAWEFVKKEIDNNIPVIAWEMKIPEYYCVHGYDDVGYYYHGCLADKGEGPKPWQELGQTDIGLIDVISIHPGKKAKPEKVVKDAFKKALWFADNPKGYVYPKYASGLKAYDYWLKFLDGKIDYEEIHAHGIGYNGEVWSECRRFAVDFLNEAKTKVGQNDELFDEAIRHYIAVRENLSCAAHLFPFHNRQLSALQDADRRNDAIGALKIARAAEEKGLKALKEISKAL